MPRRVAIVGGGISGLGAAWALHRHPDRFEFRLFEAQDQVGGNAVTADMPQDDGTAIPFDISVTACIPSVYHHILLLMQQHGIELVDTRFSYSVKYRGGIYAHDFDSDIRRQLQPEIEKFQRLLRRLKWFGRLNRSRSRLLNALNPFNYVSMGTVLNFGRFSGDFRYKILKPMFVNFLMATNVFDMPASLFARYLEFFDIETATPMQTWDRGTRRIYENLSAEFRDRIYLGRPVRKVYRRPSGVVVEDENGNEETFDDVVFACNANQTLMILEQADLTGELASLLDPLRERAAQPYGRSFRRLGSSGQRGPAARHPEQPYRAVWRAAGQLRNHLHHAQSAALGEPVGQALPGDLQSDQPDRRQDKIVKRWWFQHIVHDVPHIAFLIHLFRFVQGKRRTWHCGAHTLINSQETCFVTGLVTARQMGADYPFRDSEARKWFNFYGRTMYGWRFRKA